MNNETPVLERNIHEYERIEKLHKIIFIIYTIICAGYALPELFRICFGFNTDYFYALNDAVISKGIIFIFGYLGLRNHSNQLLIISAIISFFSIFFVESNVSFYDIVLEKIGLKWESNAFISVIITVAVIIAIPINNKYNFMQKEEKEYHQRYSKKDKLKAHQEEIENQKNQNLTELKNNYGSDMIPIKVNSNSLPDMNYHSGQSDKMTDIDLNYQSNDLGQVQKTE